MPKKPSSKKTKKTPHGSRKHPTPPGGFALFIKAFTISCLVFSSVLFGGTYVVSHIRPPQLPPVNPPSLLLETPAYVDVEPDALDVLIGGGMRAPEGFTSEDRKELFYTFLIVGLDQGANTDTIIVASYDAQEHIAHAISIPRDTRVNVSRRVRKINAAHPAGTRFGEGPDSGIRQLKREVRTLIGFEPDFYVELGHEGFVRLIDAIGGVELNVPFHMRYDDPFQNLSVNIPEGLHLLNGESALQFARFRHSNHGYRSISDFDRMKNQQAVISAAIDRLIRPESILRIPEFISIFQENVRTNMTPSNILWFASQLRHFEGAQAFTTYTLPIARNSGPPSWYEFPDINRTLELINSTINPFTLPISQSDIDIVQ